MSYEPNLIINKPPGWELYQTQTVMNNLEYVVNKLNKWCDKHYKWFQPIDMCEDMARRLGNPNFETLIMKLFINEVNFVKVKYDNFDEWNKQLLGTEIYDITSVEEFNKLYTSICNYKF